MSGAGRVIVGVSESPGSLPALRSAENLARREDAPLLAVHAVCPVFTVPPPALRPRSLRHRELTLDQALSVWDGETLGRDRR